VTGPAVAQALRAGAGSGGGCLKGVAAPAPPQAGMSPRPLRVLTFTSLYPNRAMPTFGVFVENRIRRVAETGAAEFRVVAPVPWFPIRHRAFGAYGLWAGVPREESRHGIPVLHPRYPLPPRIGTHLHPFLMAARALPVLRRVIAAEDGFDFDLIDAHYYYPDGVAALLLGHRLGKPVVITARGSDLNLYPRRYPLIRRLIAWTARHAAASIAVSAALGEVLRELGAPRERVHVLRNGVDLDLFRPPADRAAARRALGAQEGPVVLVSVGNLVELKGHDLVIEALASMPDTLLLIIGEGPERRELVALASRIGVGGRVRYLGRVAHEGLAAIYGAADALILASSREGWPNVLLEAMACGTPVIASRVGGVPEMVNAPEAGLLLPERSAAAIAGAVAALLADPPQREATRRHAERFSWDETVRRQIALFRAVAADHAAVDGRG
jgi:glycosyltransferase involved in cell wall biosynthesis